MEKLFYLLFMMLFLVVRGISAQETNSTELSEVVDSLYWVGPESNYERVLNPNKFGDNWFITVNAGTFISWCDNMGSANFGKQFQPAAGLSVGKWISP